MDFLLSGISNVEDTEFKTPDGKPDADRYSAALKDQLTGMGMEIRFVKVFMHRDGDFRGSTCARIGGLVADKDKILSSEFWPKNVLVRPWNFNTN